MAKKNPFTFTLMFNPENPVDQKAVAIINRQGRSKSHFIASAVLHFVECNQIPPSSLVQDQQLEALIEQVVRKTIAAYKQSFTPLGTMPVSPEPSPQAPVDTPHNLSGALQEQELSEGDSSVLVAGLDAFRKK